MLNSYSKTELIGIGFASVGNGVVVSKDARLYEINGVLGDSVRIDAFSILTGRIVLDANVHISPFCFLGGTGGVIEMKHHSGLSSHVSVFTKSADYSTHQREGADKITGDVYIGEHTVIGSGTKILPGTTISEHVSVGCNSVINQNIERGSIIVSRNMGLVTISKKS